MDTNTEPLTSSGHVFSSLPQKLYLKRSCRLSNTNYSRSHIMGVPSTSTIHIKKWSDFIFWELLFSFPVLINNALFLPVSAQSSINPSGPYFLNLQLVQRAVTYLKKLLFLISNILASSASPLTTSVLLNSVFWELIYPFMISETGLNALRPSWNGRGTSANRVATVLSE